ncbi:hypothetical protein [Kribbia dieselivorans]|uniref:hypothetical protein n=1 Tax=Kribbia dieselivorans TaxID=331526 RepID=UPI0008383EA9|nr:hypothetical protein [Kribbia dieselivorans]
MIVAAALVAVSVIVAAGDGKPFANTYCQAVGKVIGGACAGGDGRSRSPQETPFNYEPTKCKRHELELTTNSSAKVGLIKIGENGGLLIKEYSDGTVEIVVTDGRRAGVSVGAGPKAEVGAHELGASVDFGGGLKFGAGATWTFDDVASANAFLKNFQEYRDTVMAPKRLDATRMIKGLINPPRRLPPPNKVEGSVTLTREVAGSLGLTLKSSPSTKESTGAKNPHDPAGAVDGGGIRATGEVGQKWLTRYTRDQSPHNGKDDSLTTYTTEITAKGNLSGNAVIYGAGANGYLGGSMSITKDAQGRITNITFVSTVQGGMEKGGNVRVGLAGGGGKESDRKGKLSLKGPKKASEATVVTTSVDLDPNDPRQQSTAVNWLNGNHSTVDLANGLLLNPAQRVPGNAFQNLLFDQAKVSTVTYDNVTDVQSLGLEVSMGGGLGFETGREKATATATRATYLGPPDANGVRRPINWPDCVTYAGG